MRVESTGGGGPFLAKPEQANMMPVFWLAEAFPVSEQLLRIANIKQFRGVSTGVSGR
jgi:hypothetical protein